MYIMNGSPVLYVCGTSMHYGLRIYICHMRLYLRSMIAGISLHLLFYIYEVCEMKELKVAESCLSSAEV
jgi:hypothetical protein